MTGSAGQKNRQNGFSDLTFVNQTPCSHVLSTCNCTLSNELPPVCFSKNSLASAGDAIGTSSPRAKTGSLDENLESCPKECTGSSSSGTAQTVASCFEFYASSEEGINLFVDLNSSPSDWITQMRNEVCICQNMCCRSPISQKGCGQSEKSHFQTRNSFTRNLDSGQLMDSQGKAGSFPDLIIKNKNNMQPNHPDGGISIISLMTPAVNQHNSSSELPEKFEGNSGLSSSSPLVLLEDKMVSIPPASNANGHQIICGSGFSENSVSSTIVNTATCPIIPPEAKNQFSNLYTDPAVHHSSTLENKQNTVCASEVIPSFPPGGSILVADHQVAVGSEIQPDSSSKDCNEDEFVSRSNPFVPKDALASLDEPNQTSCQNQLPTSTTEQNNGSISGIEHLGYVEDRSLDEKLDSVEVIQEPVKKRAHGDGSDQSDCNSSEDKFVRSSKLPSKKRAHGDGSDQSDCNSSEDKIVRSSKLPTGEILRRRSMRLVPKVVGMPSLFLESEESEDVGLCRHRHYCFRSKCITCCSYQWMVMVPKPT